MPDPILVKVINLAVSSCGGCRQNSLLWRVPRAVIVLLYPQTTEETGYLACPSAFTPPTT
jgi:hypothetical protein